MMDLAARDRRTEQLWRCLHHQPSAYRWVTVIEDRDGLMVWICDCGAVDYFHVVTGLQQCWATGGRVRG